MLSKKWSWIFLNLIIYASTVPVDSETKAFLELIELDYEDACYNTANVQWSFIISPSNETLSALEEQQYTYAEFKKTVKDEIYNTTVDNAHKRLEPFLHKYNAINKPGDALLNEDDWMKLVHLAGVVELQRSTFKYIDKSQSYSREDVENLLSHSGEVEDKQAAWSAWYHQLKPLATNYSNNLPLIAEAARENGAAHVQEYWEMLSGYSDGYERLRNEWSRIDHIYKKIFKFVSKNLSQKYGITVNDTFPAHLFGSLQGFDWTDLPSDVLPYSNLNYDIKKNLWKKKYVGKSLYKTASGLGLMLLKQVPQAEFWEESEFNQTCPARLLNLCRDGTLRVSTCSKATVSNFMTAHEDVGKILFNQLTVESTPVLNMVNRYSGLEEGISTLFGILSTSPAWLNYTHLMDATNDNQERMIVSLMITALHILPRLAYYYSADMWRINAIDKNITDPVNLTESWWKYRQEYEGVSPINVGSATFLDDDYIISNKPYLSKILGIMLGFQLYEYTMDSTEVRYDNINEKWISGDIIKMIQHGGADDWKYIVNKYVDIDDVNADALVSYFRPLDEFIEDNEEDFEYKSGSREDKELEDLEKHILREMNTPTTTPPPIVTTGAPSSLSKPENNASNQAQIKEQPLKSQSSVYVQSGNLKNPDSSKPNPTTEVPTDTSSAKPDTLDDTQNDEPNINTSKTVWVVGAVLIALVAIITIAIFGRRRCRKTPKNRRYV